MNWTKKASVLVGFNNGTNKTTWDDITDHPYTNNVKIAGFDFDDTIIHHYTRVKDHVDQPWVYVSDELKNKLKELIDTNHLIVIWSNQSGLERKENEWKELVDDVYFTLCEQLNKKIFMVIMASFGNDRFRKPNLGMYHMLVKKFGFTKIKKISFCGDAGGRVEKDFYRQKFYPTGKAGDFSDGDYKFALNISNVTQAKYGIKCPFTTPEMFYLGESLPPKVLSFDPYKFMKEYKPQKQKFTFHEKELVIIMGYPSVGKTFLVDKYFKELGYDIYTRDEYSTYRKYECAVEKALKTKKSIVLANTHPTVGSRVRWVAVAKNGGYERISCYIIGASMQLAFHLNNVRMLMDNIEKFTNIVYHKFKKSLTKPSKDEGFDKIATINWRIDPELFKDEKWKKAFLTYSEGIKTKQ